MTIVKIIGALALLVTIAVQLYVFGVTRTISNEFAEIEQLGKADSSFAAGLEITGTKTGNEDKPGYVALASFGKMHDYRSVNANFYISLKDMLDAGESMPEKELIAAFVTARASRFADAECELLKKSFAAECSVSSSNGTATDNGLVLVSIGLNFIQKNDFGTIKAKARAAYVEIEHSLTGSTPDTVSFGGAAAFRSSLYGQAVKFCEKIRASEGNCAIFNVFINAVPAEQSGSAQNMTAGAIFSTLEAL